MSRTIIEKQITENQKNQIISIMDNTLRPAGYQEAIGNGESVWCKGDGDVVIMRCFSIVFTGETALIQAWTQEPIIGESTIYRGAHKIPKKEMRSLLEKIDKQIDDLKRESVNRQSYLTASGNGSYIYQNAGNGPYICQNCGRAISAGSRFCGGCGKEINFQPLPYTGSSGYSVISDTPSAAKKSEKKSGRKWIGIFLAIEVAVAVIAAAVIAVVLIKPFNKVESPQYEYDSEGNIIKKEIYDEDDGSLTCYYIYTRDSSGTIEGYTKYLADGSVDFYTIYTYDQDYDSFFSYNCSLYVEQFDADGTLEFVYVRDELGNYGLAYNVSDHAYITGGWVLLEGFLED